MKSNITSRQDTKSLYNNLKKANQTYWFFNSSNFFVSQWLSIEDRVEFEREIRIRRQKGDMEFAPLEKKLRRKAYLACNKLIKQENVAAVNTVKAWFGVGKTSVPKREHILRMGLAGKLGVEKTQEYLTKGILQPGIQVNDFRECIILYCLKHKLSVNESEDMITYFYRNLEKNTPFEQKTHTEQILKLMKEHMEDTKDEYLNWMIDNVSLFKGYGKTAYNYFKNMKEEMLHLVRKDAKESLMRELSESGFHCTGEENCKKEILAYINGGKSIFSGEKKKMLLELYWMAFDSKEKNTDFLAELYSSAIDFEGNTLSKRRIHYFDKNTFFLPEEIVFMTEKHVSQLLSIAVQKEKTIRLQALQVRLEQMDDRELCDQDALGLIGKKEEETITVKEMRGVLKKLLKHQEQRCEQIQRDDLLPLILWVFQKKHQSKLQKNNEKYDATVAKTSFQREANEILEACNMEKISKEYVLDYLLLATFGKQDMYSLADLIELSKNLS